MKLLLGGLALLLLALVPGGGADGDAFAPCQGVIGGAALSSDGQRIVVPENGTVTYEFSASSPVRSWRVALSYGVGEATVAEGTSDSDATSAAGEANVSDYATLGGGLYRVDAEVVLASGETCAGTVYVEVATNPFETVAGWVAVAAGAGGIAVAGGASVAAAKGALAALVK